MSYADINRVVLVGRLTRDPELRVLPSGTELCSLRVACNGRRKEADGSFQPKPAFFNINAFGGQAANVARYTAKGSRVAIDGRLEWSEWETAEGAKRQAVEVIAERVEFLSHGEAGGQDGASHHHGLGGEDSVGVGDDDPGDEPGRPLAMMASGIDDEVEF